MKAAQLDDGTWALLYEEQAEQAAWPREPVTRFRMWTGDPRNESTGGAPAGVTTEGGGEGGSGGEGGGEGGTGTETATPDLEELFAGFRNDVLTRFDGIEEQLTPEQKQEPAPKPPAIFDSRNFSDDDYDENGMLTQEAQQRALQSEISRQVAEAMAPVHEGAADERRNAQADSLETKYPVFADPEARAPIIHAAQQAAAKLAGSQGRAELRDLWREPEFLETVYLGIVGQQAAEREAQAAATAAQQGGVTLERGGSAGPAAGGSGANGEETANRLVSLAHKEKFRLGS